MSEIKSRKKMLARQFIGMLCLCGGVLLSAEQRTSMQTSSPKPVCTRAAVSSAKLTKQQKAALEMLSAASTEAQASAPDVRSFIVWQISRGYTRVNRRQSESALKDAFSATLSIDKSQDRCTHAEPELCGTRYWLQKEILQDAIQHFRRITDVEPMVAIAEPEVQQVIRAHQFRRYLHEKSFDRAEAILTQMMNDNGYFSYENATELIDALPQASRDSNRIFTEALDAYNQHKDEKYPSVDDFPMMVTRVWHSLPSSVVLEAIDLMLQRAKDADEGQRDFVVGVGAQKGDAFFSSVYQFRVYQLMPILRQLDETRAESLTNDNDEVRSAFASYPQGLMSPSTIGRGLNVGTLDRSEVSAEQARYEATRRVNEILAEASSDPKQAIADALGLPLSNGAGVQDGPRFTALNSIVHITLKARPDLATVALAELRKLASDLAPRGQAAALGEVPELYLQLGDQQDSRDSLGELRKIAAKLYSEDSEPNNPNLAFKGMWPSVSLWNRCLAVAARMEPSLFEELMLEIPDLEIKGIERVTFANSLLGVGSPQLSVVEKHGKDVSASIIP